MLHFVLNYFLLKTQGHINYPQSRYKEKQLSRFIRQYSRVHGKKRLAVFPSPAGISLTGPQKDPLILDVITDVLCGTGKVSSPLSAYVGVSVSVVCENLLDTTVVWTQRVEPIRHTWKISPCPSSWRDFWMTPNFSNYASLLNVQAFDMLSPFSCCMSPVHVFCFLHFDSRSGSFFFLNDVIILWYVFTK